MHKTCPGSYLVLDPRVHLASTLAVYALLLLGWAIVRLLRVQPLRQQRVFHWIIAVLTPVAVILFFVKVHARDLSVRTCLFWSPFHVFTLLVDTVFFIRFVVEILEGHVPEPIPSMTDCWLLVNTVWKLVKHVVIGEYQFLVLMRLLYPQTLEMYAMLFTRLFGMLTKKRLFQLGIVIVGVLVFAGAIQTAEEWSQLLGIHPDADGQVTAWHSYWDYIYMGFTTMSTVGYGDMTPSTVASQAIVIIAIIGYINWFAANCQAIFYAVKGLVVDMRRRLPPLPRHRRMVVVGCLDTHKMQQLLDELSVQEETQVIVIITREESLSIRQVPGVFVIQSNLNRNLIKHCFPKHLMKRAERQSDTLMFLNQQGDGDEVGARDSDLYVLSLVQMVKAERPELPVVAQVWWRESLITIQNMKEWRSGMDQVLSYEGVMSGLMTQAVVAEGAASILATLITTSSSPVPTLMHACTDTITRAHLAGQGLVLVVADSESEEEESFEEAALHYYLDGILLLGYVEHTSESAAQDRCYILPTILPPDAQRVMLVPPHLTSNKDMIKTSASHHSETTQRSIKTSASHHSETTQRSPPDLESPNVHLKDKTMWVVRDGVTGGVASSASQRSLRVVSEEDADVPIDAAVLLEPLNDPNKARYNYYCAKAHLADMSHRAPLVSNVEHGLQPGVWKVSAGCPHACTSFVNPSIVTSAVCLAYNSEVLFRVWRFLVQECLLVEVQVNGYYSYGQMFQYLLTRRKMLALGVTVQVNSHSRANCTATVLNLNPEDKGRLAVTNPHHDFCLHPGDKVVAFPLVFETYTV